MESHQNLKTHAVHSAIQLQGNNRVLKRRTPPISDEEQRLNRRQRCTLSQLRLGHCHLLQDYTHRVLVEPSEICTVCEASPHDVRHLFACTTHPTDLSPEDLWRKPVGYLILHPSLVVDVRKGIRSKNAASILFINTPGKGVL